MDGFYVAKDFQSAYGHTVKAHKKETIPLAFLLFKVPLGFFSNQNPEVEKGMILTEDMEKWNQIITFFKNAEDKDKFVKNFKDGSKEERREKFDAIKEEMKDKNGPETVSYIRGPFSKWDAKGNLGSGHQWEGDQVCIRTKEKVEKLESCLSTILFVR